MKKWLIALVAVVLAVALSLGTIFIVRAIKDKKQSEEVLYNISYLASEYVAGDTLVFGVRAFSDKEINSVVYTIDNGEEISVTVSAGETKEAEKDNGKYVVDSGTETVSLANLSVGEHLIKFYVYDAEGTRYALGKAQLFTIVGAN